MSITQLFCMSYRHAKKLQIFGTFPVHIKKGGGGGGGPVYDFLNFIDGLRYRTGTGPN
jgi:hypothetical protein